MLAKSHSRTSILKVESFYVCENSFGLSYILEIRPFAAAKSGKRTLTLENVVKLEAGINNNNKQ